MVVVVVVSEHTLVCVRGDIRVPSETSRGYLNATRSTLKHTHVEL